MKIIEYYFVCACHKIIMIAQALKIPKSFICGNRKWNSPNTCFNNVLPQIECDDGAKKKTYDSGNRGAHLNMDWNKPRCRRVGWKHSKAEETWCMGDHMKSGRRTFTVCGSGSSELEDCVRAWARGQSFSTDWLLIVMLKMKKLRWKVERL